MARRLALALPEVTEDPHRDKPAFRVNRRIFMMMRSPKPTPSVSRSMFAPLGGERPVVLLKLDREDQVNLTADRPDAIEPAPDYPHHGWTHVWVQDIDARELSVIIRLAWANVAPRRLLKAST